MNILGNNYEKSRINIGKRKTYSIYFNSWFLIMSFRKPFRFDPMSTWRCYSLPSKIGNYINRHELYIQCPPRILKDTSMNDIKIYHVVEVL